MTVDKVCRFVVEEAGVRLDKYVSEVCPGLSRSQAQKLIDRGLVMVNGRAGKAGTKLNAADGIEVVIPPPPPASLSAEDIPVKIVYEDNDVLVVDKPAGLTVYPAAGHTSHTLVNAILPHLPEAGDSMRPGIVHRLDKDTSGLMVLARNSAAQQNLIDQFRTRSVKKFYTALVKGRLTPERGIIEAPIGRDARDRKRMGVVASGREARTQYKVIKYLDGYSLLEVKIETGRTHQIRVHLSAIGYPVVGDKVYGVKSTFLSRQFLHSSRLGFRLPPTGEYVEFASELPEDLARTLKELA